MAKLSSRRSDVGDVLVLESERSRAEVVPQRGGIVSSFAVDGRELLYLDPATLADPSKNVRGGIPVLFPSPGKLKDDRFAREGKQGELKQHGFARNLAWKPARTSAAEAEVTLSLLSNEQTLAQFPWEFRYDLTVSLAAQTLRLGISVQNTGTEVLPCGLGFHPYFLLTDKNAKIDTRATTIFDNVSKRQGPFQGFDFTRKEQDIYLLDHGSSASALHYHDGSQLAIRASSEFSLWVVWSLADKDYVCIEPWTTPPNALNTDESLLHIAPGASHEGWVEFALKSQ
jgi:galactose mutarotase-like enzyme